jgi:hypothetical protein
MCASWTEKEGKFGIYQHDWPLMDVIMCREHPEENEFEVVAQLFIGILKGWLSGAPKNCEQFDIRSKFAIAVAPID